MRLSDLAGAIALTMCALAAAHANDPKAMIADLDQGLARIGPPKIDGSEALAGKQAPAPYCAISHKK